MFTFTSLKVGLDVIAQPDNDDQKMYLAVIREVTKKEGESSLLCILTLHSLCSIHINEVCHPYQLADND